MFKEVQIVLLSDENQESKLVLETITGKLHYLHTLNSTVETTLQPYQIYVISDDEIKLGDWYMYIDLQGNPLFPLRCSERSIPDSLDRKIIATTDKSLLLQYSLEYKITVNEKSLDYNLPGLSQEFLDMYINKYNSEEVLSKAFVEYCISSPVNKKNNTIHITFVNPTRSKVLQNLIKENPDLKIETIELITKYIKQYAEDSLTVDRYKEPLFTKTWIENNLQNLNYETK